MRQRRRHPRFTLEQTWEASFNVFHDVTIHSWTTSSVWVIAARPLPRDMVLGLDVGTGPDGAHGVQAAVTVPFVHDGEMWHRVRLDRVGGMKCELALCGRRALVWERTALQIVDVGAGGCLVDLDAPVAAGAIGRLRTLVREQRFVDDIRVVWSRPSQNNGLSVYRAGVELFPIMRAPATADMSLRDVLSVVGGGRDVRVGSTSRQGAGERAASHCSPQQKERVR